ncbi:MAG: hypothetical protein QG632_472 [Candidatus Dependentiae bacterium]|nr:hypothetical protein [Candidatus Dependentiae bacterium]
MKNEIYMVAWKILSFLNSPFLGVFFAKVMIFFSEENISILICVARDNFTLSGVSEERLVRIESGKVRPMVAD